MCNKLLFYFVLFLIPNFIFGLNCTLQLSGYIHDTSTDEPLEFVHVFIKEIKSGATSDSLGFFKIDNLCHGDYHVTLSHIGCESKQFFLHIHSDTTLQFFLDHSIHTLQKIELIGSFENNNSLQSNGLKKQEILDDANKNLSNMLEKIPGMRSIKNGNGIAKPSYHGLYGNRLTILNNGVAQSGQQWGNDHSPEIDPLASASIQLITGVSTLQYLGSHLGAIVRVDAKNIKREPHLHGRVNYQFQSNGRGHGIHADVQKYSKLIAWKLNATIKKSGDQRTPDYFLNNTGYQELNGSLQLEKAFSEKFKVQGYFSTFNTELGVLRGSHISNLTDLQAAIGRQEPFFTERTFSYDIEAPSQEVNHHLIKLKSNYFIDNDSWIEVVAALQINKRKEYDVRRSGRTDIPALSLDQNSYFIETKWQKKYTNKDELKAGIQLNLVDNTNDAETGILPLIPDYFNTEGGAFFIFKKQLNKSNIGLGLRYDFVDHNVVSISNTTPREILRYNNQFHNFSVATDWNHIWNDFFSTTIDVSAVMRNPAINELYSMGLHQGVSGIEEGDIDLRREKAWNSSISVKAKISKHINLEGTTSIQRIDDYIFLAPQNKFRVTIRGAFPVFTYEQTDALIYGFDLVFQIEFSNYFQSTLKYSYLNGDDLNNNLGIVNLPGNQFSFSQNFSIPRTVKWGKAKLENVAFNLNQKYVWEQKNIELEQDFLAPPPGYFLLGFKFTTEFQLPSNRLRLICGVDNVLNEVFRDYLNRQRYFADGLGRNLHLGINLEF